ncbi:SWIM zinc finger family protein [Streptomyces sp. NPDC026665]|uniref:SWIM zinc finger family protein n=1 Tax=Streptomyces sp. NPDC026665 TaxID=3154798 RepID=UPI0033E4D8F7
MPANGAEEPADGAGPRPPVTGDRPADEARRALRAARKAAAADEHTGAGTGTGTGAGAGASTGEGTGTGEGADRDAVTGESPVPTAPSRPSTVSGTPEAPPRASAPAARPSDAAREALRRTTAAEPSTTGGSGAEAGSGARPGDIAREALRAARDEARRLRSEEADGGERPREGGSEGAGPRRRSGRTSPARAGGRRSPAHPVTTDRLSQQRRLHDLLADAFRLPPDVAAETGQPSDPDAHTDADETTRDRNPGRLARAPYTEHDEHLERPRHDEHPERPRRGEHAAHPRQPEDPAHPHRPENSAHPEHPGLPEDFAPARHPEDPDRQHYPEESTPPAPEWEASASEPFRFGSLVPELFGRGPGAKSPEAPETDRPTGDPVTAIPAGRRPRSMASPGRDGELRRTFPAFPPRVPEEDGFAETWWGNAWVTALEEGALDAARLARGRTYAGHGHVDAVTVTPGLVLAYVHGSRPRPYRVQVRVRTLTDDDWDRFLDAAAERPGHIAALLDKEMPRSLADCGVELLPGPGELEPHCSCPDFGHPCKHAAALCYQTARLLDQDPFVLFLLRGRGERELLDALSRRNATRAARAAQDREPARPAGVRASDVLARGALPPLPAPLPPPAHPGQPPAYPGVPGGPDAFALDQLATDAAARAHALLTSGRDPVAELTLWQDAVRVAAARPGSGLTAATRALYSSLASATGRTPVDLARAVAAWRQGGYDALAVLEEPWDPPAGRFDRARPLLMAADFPAFRPWRNHLTHPQGHAQLRLGRNGLWYAYESEPGHDDWWPRGTPDLDPVGALTGLGAPDEL